MIFGFWRPCWLTRPKKNGWYLCTLESGRVLQLYFDTGYGGKWIDRQRKSVFDGYKCYKAGREPLAYNRVFEDGLCERINVIAWMKLPRRYGWWKKRE